ncbi:hypothetical protein RND81_12G040600 [Saponaria officinalis]|uniref:VQ domain-containing protein n=1 Tax=Saponaria officinalis TaxID=3572 RepID=A0AAW1H6B0_SAPOF
MTYTKSNITTPPPSQTLGLHRSSRTISKIQPKIRIIHMYAPEIINTDVANFRELVQRLTGMPTSVDNRPGFTSKDMNKDKDKRHMTKNNKRVVNPGFLYTGSDDVVDRVRVSTKLNHDDDDDQGFWRTTTVDLNSTTTSGGFLNAFSDLDDNFDLSMLNMSGSSNHHHLNSFGETTQVSFRG